MLQPQHYARIQQSTQATQPTIQRRNPFANAAINHQKTPPKPPQKGPASPPLPRQNSKTTPPSPPKIITDKSGRFQFSRVGFLGEGGFARVYEVKDTRGTRFACKVITKSSLMTKKAKTKLYAEIKIHRSLEHHNIVVFYDCFEDEDNVYMTLELCASGSLMDMLRRRRRFTEPESRFFMVQLIGACHYMHAHQVIHRDLKLGNLFLDANMNVKVGDFGLAALIENPGERKKTICGTPNYIAPEVLFDTVNGHSFEVDTWSIGVILYTFLIGRPPFQTKEVKSIYKRIRDNEYEFPKERAISRAAQHLIQLILAPDPSQRPTLHDIVDHEFFVRGPVPAYIPTSAHDSPPDFRHISRAASDANLRRLRKYALLDVDYSQLPPPTSITPAALAPSPVNARNAPPVTTTSKNITVTIAQQEKEFQKAVQPGSPISALLSSARQPLLMTSPGVGGNGHIRENPLLRKLQVVKESPLGRRAVTRTLDGTIEEKDTLGGRRRPSSSQEDGMQEEEELRSRKKELEAQKARIVAQMAPVREEVEDQDEQGDVDEYAPVVPAKDKEVVGKGRYGGALADRGNAVPPAGKYGSLRAKSGLHPQAQPLQHSTSSKGRMVDKENVQITGHTHLPSAAMMHTATIPAPPPPKANGFDAVAQTLCAAFDARAAGRVYRDPHFGSSLDELPEEKVFIVSWVDYCNKYGMGYALTDGSVGVHFNDSTTLVLSPNKIHFDYTTSRRQGLIYMRKSYSVKTYPEELKSKVYLLKHFENYIMQRLYGEYEYTFEDTKREKGMEWVQKYLRMKHVIVFKLSHDVLQFNFYDHSKLILSSHGNLVTHIDKHYKMSRWALSEVMAQSLRSSTVSGTAQHDPDSVKFNQKLVDKLKYCKEVLVSIRTASSGTDSTEESDAMMGDPGVAGTSAGVTAVPVGRSASRMALR